MRAPDEQMLLWSDDGTAEAILLLVRRLAATRAEATRPVVSRRGRCRHR